MIRYETQIITLPEFKMSEIYHFSNPKVCYTLYGDWQDGKKKRALFFHGFSSNSELHTWWKKFNFLELLKSYNIICINSLGSSHGTLGPNSINTEVNAPYFKQFPKITISDTVDFSVKVLQHLGFLKFDLVFGCSLGGMQSLDMFLRYSEMSEKFISVAGTPLSYMTKFINLAQAKMIDEADLDKIESALGFARFFFRLSCTTEQALNIFLKKYDAFSEVHDVDILKRCFVEDNIKFQTQFSPYSNSLYLKMMSYFSLGDILLSEKKSTASLLLVSIENDQFTPESSVNGVFESMSSNKYPVQLRHFETAFGHEAWIVDGGRFYEFIKKDLYF